MINSSAVKLRALLGADSQDWSDHIRSFDIGFNKRSRDGLLQIQGTLVLGWTLNVPENVSPRFNQARWARGNRVLIQVLREDEQWVNHPCGYLYILREPAPPSFDEPDLQLEVGCILTLKDYAEPDDDASGVTLGEATSRTTITQNILRYAGITNTSISIPDYPLSYPIPKVEGSFVSQAGQVAYGGLRALRQNSSGTVTTSNLWVDYKVTPTKTIYIGEDDISFKYVNGGETPVEKLKCVGTTKDVQDQYGEYISIAESFDGRNLIRYTKTVDVLDVEGKFDSIEVKEQAKLVHPSTDPSTRLAFKSYTTKRHYYDPKDKKLLRVEEPTTTVLEAIAPELVKVARYIGDKYLLGSHLVTIGKTTYYTYANDGTVRRIKEVTTNAIGVFHPIVEVLRNLAITIGAQVVTELEVITEWEQLRPNYWVKTTTTKKPFCVVSPRLILDPLPTGDLEPILAQIAANVRLITSDVVKEQSSSGNTQPPATEYEPKQYSDEEKQIKGEANFNLKAPEQKRERTITVPYADSTQQLDKLALLEGTLLIGRRLAMRIQVPFDEWFLDNPEPLPIWHIYEPDGSSHIYQIDALSFIHEDDKAIVGGDGIWLARIPAGATLSDVQPTYNLVFTDFGGSGYGGEDTFYRFEEDLGSFTDFGGSGYGGTDNVITTLGDISEFGGYGFGGEDTLETPGVVDLTTNLTAAWVFEAQNFSSAYEDQVGSTDLVDDFLSAYESASYNAFIEKGAVISFGSIAATNTTSIQPTSAFTISFVFEYQGNGTLINKGSSPTDYTVEANATGGNHIRFTANATTLGSVGTALITNDVYLVVCYNNPSGNMGVYVRSLTTGVIHQNQTSTGASNNVSTNSLTVSASQIIYCLGFWKKILSSDEIDALYNSGDGLQHPYA